MQHHDNTHLTDDQLNSIRDALRVYDETSWEHAAMLALGLLQLEHFHKLTSAEQRFLLDAVDKLAAMKRSHNAEIRSDMHHLSDRLN